VCPDCLLIVYRCTRAHCLLIVYRCTRAHCLLIVYRCTRAYEGAPGTGQLHAGRVCPDCLLIVYRCTRAYAGAPFPGQLPARRVCPVCLLIVYRCTRAYEGAPGPGQLPACSMSTLVAALFAHGVPLYYHSAIGRFRCIAWVICPYRVAGNVMALRAGKRAPGFMPIQRRRQIVSAQRGKRYTEIGLLWYGNEGCLTLR